MIPFRNLNLNKPASESRVGSDLISVEGASWSQPTVEIESIKESEWKSICFERDIEEWKDIKIYKYFEKYVPESSIEEQKLYRREEVIESNRIEMTNHWRVYYAKAFEYFESNSVFKKSTPDFIKKLETHFKNKKWKQEWTSLLNAVHNLYTQHIGRIMK